MIDPPLNVTVHGESVGNLARADAVPGGTSFRYRDSATASQAVSLIMPVRRDDYQWQHGLHPIFEMHLPEGILRERLTQMFSKAIHGFDDLHLLSIVGPHQLGRVVVGGKSDAAQPGTSISELLVHDGAQGLFEDLLTQYAQYSGVSGVQPKVLVRDEGSTEIGRVTHKGATHIVKAWRPEDYPQLSANEYFCMLAARKAGLEVANVQLSHGGKFLIVERFDIGAQGYLGLEDLCGLNGWSGRKKYDGSYEGCARQIRSMVDPASMQTSMQQFFESVALTAAVQNGDAHMKNFSLLYEHAGEDARIRLAPTYDIVSTTPYKPNDMMALLMEGSKAFPKHKRLASFGRKLCGLTEHAIVDTLQRMADGISAARAEMVQYMKDHPEFEVTGEKMLEAWDKGVARSLEPEQRPVVVDMGKRL
jgi:serine/threonine-protein kinase HipA